ncbi:MAG: LysE family translocator, partial [Caldimonas sp.]
ILTNVLNPKVALFFLALLPQFIAADAPDKLLAFLFLGAWFVVQGGLFLIGFVVLVAPLGRWRASTAWKRGLNAAGAGLFAWLAVRLALVART